MTAAPPEGQSAIPARCADGVGVWLPAPLPVALGLEGQGGCEFVSARVLSPHSFAPDLGRASALQRLLSGAG